MLTTTQALSLAHKRYSLHSSPHKDENTHNARIQGYAQALMDHSVALPSVEDIANIIHPEAFSLEGVYDVDGDDMTREAQKGALTSAHLVRQEFINALFPPDL